MAEELAFESDEELMIELVSLPHFKALKRVLRRREELLKQRLLSPARKFPDDFYAKEQVTSELRAYQTILVEVEKQVERVLRKKRE